MVPALELIAEVAPPGSSTRWLSSGLRTIARVHIAQGGSLVPDSEQELGVQIIGLGSQVTRAQCSTALGATLCR